MSHSTLNDLFIDLTEKGVFRLAIGTDNERQLKMPPNLGKLFDEQFTAMAKVQQMAAQNPSLGPLIPVLQGVFVLWAYTANESELLHKQIAELRGRLAVLEQGGTPTADLPVEPDPDPVPESGGDPPPA